MRRLIGGGAAATLLALVAGGGWWLSRPDTQVSWPGKDRFCVGAETFVVGNQHGLSHLERLAALETMVDSAHQDVAQDLQILMDVMTDHHSGEADEVMASGKRAGEFIERTCGLNLPSIRT